MAVQLMEAVVTQLSLDDMISIAAYTASLKP
jgi:cytochrome c553